MREPTSEEMIEGIKQAFKEKLDNLVYSDDIQRAIAAGVQQAMDGPLATLSHGRQEQRIDNVAHYAFKSSVRAFLEANRAEIIKAINS